MSDMTISVGVDGTGPDPEDQSWVDEPDHVYERLFLGLTYPRLPTDEERAAAEAWAEKMGLDWPPKGA